MVLLRTPQGDFAFGYGATELGGTIPPRADTHFRAASNTKTMTAAVIVLLVQDRRNGRKGGGVEKAPGDERGASF
jgi:CubicO group peptidase (beta-lactamase class C family)